MKIMLNLFDARLHADLKRNKITETQSLQRWQPLVSSFSNDQHNKDKKKSGHEPRLGTKKNTYKQHTKMIDRVLFLLLLFIFKNKKAAATTATQTRTVYIYLYEIIAQHIIKYRNSLFHSNHMCKSNIQQQQQVDVDMDSVLCVLRM